MDKTKGEEDPLYIVGGGIRPLPPLSARAPAVLPLALQRYYRQLAVLPLAAAVLPLALQRYYRWPLVVQRHYHRQESLRKKV